MLNLVFLPATEPGDERYGIVPEQIDAYPDVSVRKVSYPKMVWYNDAVREEAIGQIRAWAVAPIILVGFSKSGLGAWNIARAIPDCISATLIFDAPVAREQLPPWGTDAFYADDAAWRVDLPLRTVREFRAAMLTTHQLILISGETFHRKPSRKPTHLCVGGIEFWRQKCPTFLADRSLYV